MNTKDTNVTEPAEIGQEEVMREIDNYLREIRYLQEKMEEDRKQIDASLLEHDKRMENIDRVLDRIDAAQAKAQG